MHYDNYLKPNLVLEAAAAVQVYRGEAGRVRGLPLLSLVAHPRRSEVWGGGKTRSIALSEARPSDFQRPKSVVNTMFSDALGLRSLALAAFIDQKCT